MAGEQVGTRKLLLNGVFVGEIDVTGDNETDAATAVQFLKQKGLHREAVEPANTVKAMFRQVLSFATAAA